MNSTVKSSIQNAITTKDIDLLQGNLAFVYSFLELQHTLDLPFKEQHDWLFICL